MKSRTTPYVSSIKDNEVFVFGSNESGRHGKGAAKTAMKWGAVYGKAEGIQGNTYGIPTVNASISNKLSLTKIAKYVTSFIEYAKVTQEKTYYVTEIGCGLAGWEVKDIAPLFISAVHVQNIHLPAKFWKILDNLTKSK